jgi:hypothetical protein
MVCDGKPVKQVLLHLASLVRSYPATVVDANRCLLPLLQERGSSGAPREERGGSRDRERSPPRGSSGRERSPGRDRGGRDDRGGRERDYDRRDDRSGRGGRY